MNRELKKLQNLATSPNPSRTCLGCAKVFPHGSNLAMHYNADPVCKLNGDIQHLREQPQTNGIKAEIAKLVKRKEKLQTSQIVPSKSKAVTTSDQVETLPSKNVGGRIEKQTEEIRDVSEKIKSFKSPAPVASRVAAKVKQNAERATKNVDEHSSQSNLKRGRMDPEQNAPTPPQGAPPRAPTPPLERQEFKEILERTKNFDRVVNTSKYLQTGEMNADARLPRPFSRLEDQLFLQTLQQPWAQLKREQEGDEDDDVSIYDHCDHMLRGGSFNWPGIYCKARESDGNAFKQMTSDDLINRWKKITKFTTPQSSIVTRLEDQTVVENSGMAVSEGYASRHESEPWRFAKRLRMTQHDANVGEVVKRRTNLEHRDAVVLLDFGMKLHKLEFSRKISTDDDEPAPLDNKLYFVVNKWFELHKKTEFTGSIFFDPSNQRVNQEMLSPLFGSRREFQRDDCYESLEADMWARMFKDIPLILTVE